MSVPILMFRHTPDSEFHPSSDGKSVYMVIREEGKVRAIVTIPRIEVIRAGRRFLEQARRTA